MSDIVKGISGGPTGGSLDGSIKLVPLRAPAFNTSTFSANGADDEKSVEDSGPTRAPVNPVEVLVEETEEVVEEEEEELADVVDEVDEEDEEVDDSEAVERVVDVVPLLLDDACCDAEDVDEGVEAEDEADRDGRDSFAVASEALVVERDVLASSSCEGGGFTDGFGFCSAVLL